jgi:hypothetical protein
LWNADGTLLTLWLDPGRIKRGLHPNRELGAPLMKGEHYTLIVSDQWKDIQGIALSKPYFKKMVATSRDSLRPDPHAWAVDAPQGGTRNALIVDLKSPLDYSLLNSALAVIDERTATILGTWQVGEKERSVLFIPDSNWAKGTYQLQIETRLEDLAGNNINRPFEVDLKTQTSRPAEKVVSISFIVE